MLFSGETKRVTSSGLLFLALTCGCASPRPSESQAFLEWATDHAIVLEDLESEPSSAALESIREAIGSARLVGLGESRHDTREQLLFKGLLVRHMIQDLGFRTLILEESVPHAERLDHYVSSGDGDIPALMNQLAGWYLWDTQEMLELVQWIREFNEGRASEQQVRIFGVDITAPALAVQGVLESLLNAGIDSGVNEQSLGLDLQRGDFWPSTWERYAALSDDRRVELGENYEQLIGTLKAARAHIVASSSEPAYERDLWMAEIGRVGNEFFSSSDREAGGAIREHAMAQNTLCILDREAAGQKAILWAHNLHVAKSSFRMPGFVDGALEPMGMELSEALDGAYITIGGTFGMGSYGPDIPPGDRVFEVPSADVMDGALAAVGLSCFMVDLRAGVREPMVASWLGQEREWVAQDSRTHLVPSLAFDLVYFVGEISRAQPTPLALERFRSLR